MVAANDEADVLQWLGEAGQFLAEHGMLLKGVALGLRQPGGIFLPEFNEPPGHADHPHIMEPGAQFEGLSLGGEWERSLRLGLAAGLEAGWELWPEYWLRDSSGASTDVPRQDLLGELRLGLDGLAGFFLDWELEASAGLRWSTANRYPSAALGLEEGSENSLHAALGAAAEWSPHRALGLRLEGFLRQEWYLTRAALTAALADTGETLRVLTFSLMARADWTPNNRLFLVLEGSAGRSFANDPAEQRWNASFEAGVEYSF